MTDMKLQDDTVGLNAAQAIEPPDPRRIPVRFTEMAPQRRQIANFALRDPYSALSGLPHLTP